MLRLSLTLLLINFSILSLPVLPEWTLLIAGLPLGMFLLSSKKLWLLGVILVATVYFLESMDQAVQALIPAGLIGSTSWSSGRVQGLPSNTPAYAGFVFKLDEQMPGAPKTRLLKVHWYQPGLKISTGDRFELHLQFQPVKAKINDGLGNHEDQLFFRGIQAVGIVRDFRFIENQCFWYQFDCHRAAIQTWITAVVADSNVLPLLLALAIGDSSQLTYQHRRILSATGTHHLFVVSGLHIGLFAWTCNRLFHYAGLVLHYRLLAAFACSLLFGALAGMGLSVQRALVMVGCYMLLLIFRRSADSHTGFSIALVMVLVLNPLATGDRGFWFSFCAVAILLLSQYGDVGWTGDKKLAGLMFTLKTQVCIFIGLAPLVLGVSGNLPMISALVNLVAIPWLSLVVVPPLLMAVSVRVLAVISEHQWITDVADFLLQLGEAGAEILWFFLEISADTVPAFAFGRIELVISGLAWLAIVLFILPLRLSAHWLLLLSVLPLANLSPHRPASGDLYLRVFDVGQGLSIHLQTKSQDLLYDTGSRSPSGMDSGQTVIVPALRLLGVSKLDRLILSHRDSDHVGGAQTVLRELRVLAVIGADYGDCTPSIQFYADGVYFKVFQVMQTDNDNNSSCLLRIKGNNFDILLTGDIELSAEYELIQRSIGRVDLITVPHHGSRSSSSPALLNHLMPRQAIIASGYQNAFGHPSAIVVKRYQARNIDLLNTATSGSAVYRASVDGVVLVAEALPLQTRFWQYPR